MDFNITPSEEISDKLSDRPLSVSPSGMQHLVSEERLWSWSGGRHRIPFACRRAFSPRKWPGRSEEHTSELQSLMRISYAVFCLKKKCRPLHNKKNFNDL